MLHPTIYWTKLLLQSLAAKGKCPYVYCDFHGHSRKKMIFMYGCQGADDTDAVQDLPKAINQLSPAFSFKNCSFSIGGAEKQGCARVVVYQQVGVTNSYTLESTYCGFDKGCVRVNYYPPTTQHTATPQCKAPSKPANQHRCTQRAALLCRALLWCALLCCGVVCSVLCAVLCWLWMLETVVSTRQDTRLTPVLHHTAPCAPAFLRTARTGVCRPYRGLQVATWMLEEMGRDVLNGVLAMYQAAAREPEPFPSPSGAPGLGSWYAEMIVVWVPRGHASAHLGVVGVCSPPGRLGAVCVRAV